ncbi:hypothetical protein R6Q59_034161 [Mikania micrantha]
MVHTNFALSPIKEQLWMVTKFIWMDHNLTRINFASLLDHRSRPKYPLAYESNFLNVIGVETPPSSKGPEKLSSYESGIEPIGDAWLQFRIRYYMFALVFVVFDVETVFLYPWAMSFDVLGVSVFVEALIFVLILIVGLVYAWRKGALEWS